MLIDSLYLSVGWQLRWQGIRHLLFCHIYFRHSKREESGGGDPWGFSNRAFARAPPLELCSVLVPGLADRVLRILALSGLCVGSSCVGRGAEAVALVRDCCSQTELSRLFQPFAGHLIRLQWAPPWDQGDVKYRWYVSDSFKGGRETCCLCLLLFSRLMLFSFICCVSKFQLGWCNWPERLRLSDEVKTNSLGYVECGALFVFEYICGE